MLKQFLCMMLRFFSSSLYIYIYQYLIDILLTRYLCAKIYNRKIVRYPKCWKIVEQISEAPYIRLCTQARAANAMHTRDTRFLRMSSSHCRVKDSDGRSQ